MNPQVECHSGFAYPERPVALYWQGKRLEIETIIAEWRSPQGKAFRARTKDGKTFELLYNETDDEWNVELVDSVSGSRNRTITTSR